MTDIESQILERISLEKGYETCPCVITHPFTRNNLIKVGIKEKMIWQRVYLTPIFSQYGPNRHGITIFGRSGNISLIWDRRETRNPSAGQTYLYKGNEKIPRRDVKFADNIDLLSKDNFLMFDWQEICNNCRQKGDEYGFWWSRWNNGWPFSK